jgi:hypothetical protein
MAKTINIYWHLDCTMMKKVKQPIYCQNKRIWKHGQYNIAVKITQNKILRNIKTNKNKHNN